MTDQKIWFITGAGRGMGVDFIKAALAAPATGLWPRAGTPPPRRFLTGADTIALAEQKVADLQAQIDAYRDLSTAMAYDSQ